jgi:hypothetical protein
MWPLLLSSPPFFGVAGSLAMKRSSKWVCLVGLLFIGLAVLSCKPEGKAGAPVSPVQTPAPIATVFVSPIHTPLASATPNLVFLTPAPWDIITPGPTATSTPPPDKQTFYENESHYSLKLPTGWYAYNSHGGEDSITNYDEETVTDLNKFQPGDLKINIGVGKLSTGQSLQQWVSNRIAVDTLPNPDSPMPPATATAPQPYTLGRYEGVAFYINGKQLRIMEINLLWGDQGVMVIDLMPADSPALSEALSMLSTIKFLP